MIHVGVSGPGAVRRQRWPSVPKDCPDGTELAEHGQAARRSKLPAWASSWPTTPVERLGVPCGHRRPVAGPDARPSATAVAQHPWKRWGLEKLRRAAAPRPALALLNDAVKKGGVMASNHVGGLSGAFIPVSEDDGHDQTPCKCGSALTIEKLEAMTAVCSVGLDMIVIPGDTTAEVIERPDCRRRLPIGVANSKDDGGARHPRHRPQGRRCAGLWRPAGPRAHHAHQQVQPCGHDPPRRPHPRPDAGTEKLKQ